MIDLQQFFQIMLYLFLIILVIVLIVVGIKLIITLRKVDAVIDDVNVKMKKVDGVFDIVNKTADFTSNISDKVVGAVSNFISSMFKKRKGKDKDE